jgi:hypothetical protein
MREIPLRPEDREPMRQDWPEDLTFDQSDDWEWGYSGENEMTAWRVAERRGGMIYTQVDAEGTDIYERGHHWVNRTGRYITILPKPGVTYTQRVVANDPPSKGFHIAGTRLDGGE